MVIHELTDDQCRDVLARTNLGRLGCARAEQPYIVPVFFYFDPEERSIYGFSTFGQKIDWMRSNPKVCLEVDEIINQFNWITVVVLGEYEEIGQSAGERDARRRIDELLRHRPDWWLPATGKLTAGAEHHVPIVYRIRIERMSGRQASEPIGHSSPD
jgi:hypothetical protein